MVDVQSITEQLRRVREDTDADRDVRLSLQSIEESLSGMESADAGPQADRLKEVRAELDRLGDDAAPAVADELDRLRERVREYEREAT